MKHRKLYNKVFLVLALVVFFSITKTSVILFADETETKTEQKAPSKTIESKEAQPETSSSKTMEATAMAMSGGEEPPPLEVTGGVFTSFIKERFNTDLATGSANVSIPIIAPPGRKNMQPSIALSYSSNSSNGICGVGWTIPLASIQRSTKNGVPLYSDMDNLISTAQGSTSELVEISENEYRAKIESAFMRYVYSPADSNWVVYDKSGTKYYFGTTANSRIFNSSHPDYVFAWYLEKVVDVYENAITYTYEKDQEQIYLKYIDYTSNISSTHPLNADKRIEFVHEAGERLDKIYDNHPGWQIVTAKRLDKIKVSLDANGDLAWGDAEIIWVYNLTYTLSSDTSRSLLSSIQIQDKDNNTLIEKDFGYQTLEP